MDRPHAVGSRKAPFFPDREEFMFDRRLSELLPGEFIDEMEYDPNQIISSPKTKPNSRRATTPIQRAIPPSGKGSEKRHNITDQQPSEPVKRIYGYFELTCAGQSNLLASSQVDIESGMVQFIDGQYLRVGMIAKRIERQEFDASKSKFVIVSACSDSTLIDVITNMAEIAFVISQTFVRCKAIACDVHSVEVASFRKRSLLRVHLNDPFARGLNELFLHLQAVFSVPIEFHD